MTGLLSALRHKKQSLVVVREDGMIEKRCVGAFSVVRQKPHQARCDGRLLCRAVSMWVKGPVKGLVAYRKWSLVDLLPEAPLVLVVKMLA